jgi:hypothetical protein
MEITVSLRVRYALRQVYTHSTNALLWHSSCLKNLILSPLSYGTGAIVILTMAIYVKQYIQYPAFSSTKVELPCNPYELSKSTRSSMYSKEDPPGVLDILTIDI